MRTSRLFVIAFLLLLGVAATGSAGADPGLKPRTSRRTPPPLTLVDLAGRRHSLEEYRGKVVVVNFFGTWCPPCLQEMPGLLLLARAFKDQPFTVLAVSVNDSPARLRQVFGAQQPAFTILLDSAGTAARSWGAMGFPTSYVLDAESRIRYSAEGPLAWDDLEVAKQIVALLPKTTSPPADTGHGEGKDAGVR
jgi:thiol-disulfide isomerase/thioredoxin